MSTDFDLYVPGSSWLHRMDPRVKLLLSLEITLALFLWPTPLVIGTALVLMHVWLLWIGVPARQLRWVWVVMLPLFILVPLTWFLFQPVGAPFWRWGWLQLSWSGLWHGLWVVLRLTALAFAAFLWLYTTDPSLMMRTFLGLRLPYMLALTLALALRYLPTVAGLYMQVRDAQRARGIDLDAGSWYRRLKARGPILIAVIISTLRLAQNLSWALETRALGATLAPGRRRTVWRPLRLSREDRVSLILLVALGIIMGALKWKFKI